MLDDEVGFWLVLQALRDLVMLCAQLIRYECSNVPTEEILKNFKQPNKRFFGQPWLFFTSHWCHTAPQYRKYGQWDIKSCFWVLRLLLFKRNSCWAKSKHRFWKKKTAHFVIPAVCRLAYWVIWNVEKIYQMKNSWEKLPQWYWLSTLWCNSSL